MNVLTSNESLFTNLKAKKNENFTNDSFESNKVIILFFI